MGSEQPNLNQRMKAMSPQDWMVVGGGIGAFLFSFFPFVGVSFGPMSVSVNAWHSFALLGLLILFAVTAVWGLRILKVVKLPDAPMPWPRMLGIAAAVGTVLVLLRGVTYGHHAGLQVGGILLIIAGLVMASGAIWADRTAPKTVGGPPLADPA